MQTPLNKHQQYLKRIFINNSQYSQEKKLYAILDRYSISFQRFLNEYQNLIYTDFQDLKLHRSYYYVAAATIAALKIYRRNIIYDILVFAKNSLNMYIKKKTMFKMLNMTNYKKYTLQLMREEKQKLIDEIFTKIKMHIDNIDNIDNIDKIDIINTINKLTHFSNKQYTIYAVCLLAFEKYISHREYTKLFNLCSKKLTYQKMKIRKFQQKYGTLNI